jgi:hypothetical protein
LITLSLAAVTGNIYAGSVFPGELAGARQSANPSRAQPKDAAQDGFHGLQHDVRLAEPAGPHARGVNWRQIIARPLRIAAAHFGGCDPSRSTSVPAT